MTEHSIAEPLEQRLIELLSTFCEDPAHHDHDDDHDEANDCNTSTCLPHAEQQRLGILAQNLAFLIRNKDAAYGKAVVANEIFVTMLSWDSYLKGIDGGTLAILVRTEKTTKVLQVRVEPKEKVLDKLGREVDKMLLKALLLV